MGRRHVEDLLRGSDGIELGLSDDIASSQPPYEAAHLTVFDKPVPQQHAVDANSPLKTLCIRPDGAVMAGATIQTA